MSNLSNLNLDGRKSRPSRRQSSLSPGQSPLNADLEDAYKGARDGSCSRERASPKPSEQGRRIEGSPRNGEGAETHNAASHGGPQPVSRQSPQRRVDGRRASLKEINEVQSNVPESSMGGQDVEKDAQKASRLRADTSSWAGGEAGPRLRGSLAAGEAEARLADSSFQGPSKSILVQDGRRIAELVASSLCQAKSHNESSIDTLVGAQGPGFPRQNLDSAQQAAETSSDQGGQQPVLGARIRSGTYAIKFADGIRPLLPIQRAIGPRNAEPPHKVAGLTPTHATTSSPFPVPAAMNTVSYFRPGARREVHPNAALNKSVVPKPMAKALPAERTNRSLAMQVPAVSVSPGRSSRALPTSQFCPHRSASPIRSNAQPQAEDGHQAQALAREKVLQNAGFKSKKSPFINSIKQKRVLNNQHQGSSGSLNARGNSFGSREQLQQLSQERLLRPPLLQSDSLQGSIQQEFSYKGPINDNVLVKDAAEQPLPTQEACIKPGLLQSPGKLFTNPTINEDSQGTLQIGASKLQEPIFQLQAQILSTQSIRLEKKGSSSLRQTGFNTNSMRHLEQKIMDKRGALPNHEMPGKVKVVDAHVGSNIVKLRNSIQLRKLASSGSAGTSADLHLSDNGGEPGQPLSKGVDVRHGGAEVGTRADAPSAQDPIGTLSNNATKKLTVDPSRDQLVQKYDMSRQCELEIEASVQYLIPNASGEKLESPDLTTEMEPRVDARPKEAPPTKKLKPGPPSVLDRKLQQLNKDARVRQKRLSKEHNIADPMMAIRSYSQDSEGKAEKRAGPTPPVSKLKQELGASPADVYVIQSPVLVDQILADDYADRRAKQLAAKEYIAALHEYAARCSSDLRRQLKAPLKVKEGSFEGLQGLREAQAAPFKSPPPFLAQKKRSYKVDISAEITPKRLQKGVQGTASRDNVNSTRLLEIKGFDPDSIAGPSGLNSHIKRLGVHQSTFKIEPQRSGHTTAHVSHKAFSPANIRQSLQKLMPLSPTRADERAQPVQDTTYNATGFKEPFRETTATLKANNATRAEAGAPEAASPNYDIIPTIALRTDHSTSVRNMISDIEQKLDGPLHWARDPTRRGNPQLNQNSRLESLYQRDRNGEPSSHMGLQGKKMLGTESSLTHINKRDSNNFETTRGFDGQKAPGAGEVRGQETEAQGSTQYNAGYLENETMTAALVEMLPGIMAAHEVKNSARMKKLTERLQSEGTVGMLCPDHSKETLESPPGTSAAGASGVRLAAKGDSVNRAIQKEQISQATEDRQADEAMKQIFETGSKEQSPRASRTGLNQPNQPAVNGWNQRQAAQENSPRQALLVNTENATLGQRKSELTLRNSQSSDWRQSPMALKHSLLNTTTQRQFSPKKRDYKQVLNGKYLQKQAASQASRSFLDPAGNMKELTTEQEALMQAHNLNAKSSENINIETQGQPLGQQALYLQAEATEAMMQGSNAFVAPMPPNVERDERKDTGLPRQHNETFYKSKGALINRLPRNHNFGGVIKEKKFKKAAKKGRTIEHDQQPTAKLEQKEDIREFHRKLLDEFNTQFRRNLGADQQKTEQAKDAAKKAVTFVTLQDKPTDRDRNLRSNRVIALSRSKTHIFEGAQDQPQKNPYDIATPHTPGTEMEAAVDSLKNRSTFKMVKGSVEFPTTETEGEAQPPEAQSNPVGTSYNVGILNIVKLGSSVNEPLKRIESKDQRDLTAHTEYRQAPNQNDVNTNFANCRMEGAAQNQSLGNALDSAGLATTIDQLRVNSQAESQGRMNFKIQENNIESTQKEESDVKTTQHAFSSSPLRSMNKSPSAETPGHHACKPGSNDFALILEQKEKAAESLLDAVVRIDQQNYEKSHGSEAQDQQLTHHPDSEMHEVRKASIAFTGGGSESIYADDNRMSAANVPDELRKDDDQQVEGQHSIEGDSMTQDNQVLNPQIGFVGNIAVRNDSSGLFHNFSPHFHNSMVLQRNNLNQDLRNASIDSVHSDDNNQWWSSAAPKSPRAGLRSKGHPSITEADSELYSTSPRSPIKARFNPPFHAPNGQIDQYRNDNRQLMARGLQRGESTDWPQLQRALAKGQDPAELIRQQEFTRSSLLPPIVPAHGTTPTQQTSSITPQRHQRNISQEDPAFLKATKKYSNRIAGFANMGLKKRLPVSTLHNTITQSDMAASRSNLLASHLSQKKARQHVLREQLNRTIAAQTIRTEAVQTVTQIEELTRNMRRLKPYRRKAQMPMLSPGHTVDATSLKAFISGTIERDVGKSERKIEKIQREFREFEEQLAFSAAEHLQQCQPEDLLAKTSGSFVVYQDSRQSSLPTTALPPTTAGVSPPTERAPWQAR